MKRFPLFVLMIATLFLVAATGAAYLSVGRQSTALARRPLQEIVAYTTLPTEAAAALSEAYEKALVSSGEGAEPRKNYCKSVTLVTFA